MQPSIETCATSQKLRGGYYTPDAIARFLASWAIGKATDTILEPSCGDGNLLEAAMRRLFALGASPDGVGRQLRGIELYETEAAQARQRLAALGEIASEVVTTKDFFDFDDQEWGIINQQFDVVIGNPPFLRYHNFPDAQRERAFRIMRTAGLTPNKLTNAWVPFLIAASLRLRPAGRLAMVIPAELLQVTYAAQTRAFLARQFGAITLITFRRLVFAGIQQEIVLLLAEKSPPIESGIDVIELDDAGDLSDYEVVLRERRHLKTINHAEEKWTRYYLDKSEIDLLHAVKAHPGLKRLGQLGCVDVGVVTGNNHFFVLNQETISTRCLARYTLPLIGRTAQIPGTQITDDEWQRLNDAQSLCHLLNLPAVPFDELDEAAQSYVRYGEETDVHSGFKCRNRKRWYIVPTLWVPDAFLFRQIHGYPKIVCNGANATSTDTIHRVRFHNPENSRQIAASFLNSLTFAFAEIMGRSYGGGVLELEPNEAEQIPVPYFADSQFDHAGIDRLERRGDIEAICAANDREILQNGLGLSAVDAARLRGIWRKLSGRRLGRKARATPAAPRSVESESAAHG